MINLYNKYFNRLKKNVVNNYYITILQEIQGARENFLVSLCKFSNKLPFATILPSRNHSGGFDPWLSNRFRMKGVEF